MLRILILFVALSAAGAAAWLTIGASSDEQTAEVQTAPAVASEEVLVVSADLAQGQILDATNVQWQPWPTEGINPGFITRSARPEAVTELTRSVVRSRFVTGEPIRQEKLADPDSGFLSAILPSGMRAVAIRISAESTAGGFILPNDRVDVIHTATRSGENDLLVATASKTILTNIRIIAIDQQTDESSDEAVAVGKTATLEVAPGQVEIISAAQASGLLSLSLRSAADGQDIPVAAVVAPKPTSRTVRVFSGGSIQSVEVPEGATPAPDVTQLTEQPTLPADAIQTPEGPRS